MGKAFCASTSDVDPAERIAFWNAGSSRIGGATAIALSDVFDAEVAFRRLSDLVAYRLSSTPHRVKVNLPGGGRQKMLRLRYQQSGVSTVFYGHRQLELRPGDWMILSPQVLHAAINKGDASQLWLQIPCDNLSDQEMQAALALGPKLYMDKKLDGALHECLEHAVETPGEFSQQGEQELASQMFDLFRRVLNRVPQGRSQSSGSEVTVGRARDYIEKNIHDPDLSVEQIAKALGCTPRYIHKAFEGSESVSRYIWSRRLDMCRQRLEKQPQKSQSLTDLAFAFGFSSSSHFSRTFRDRFGTSPSMFQAQVLRGQTG